MVDTIHLGAHSVVHCCAAVPHQSEERHLEHRAELQEEEAQTEPVTSGRAEPVRQKQFRGQEWKPANTQVHRWVRVRCTPIRLYR